MTQDMKLFHGNIEFSCGCSATICFAATPKKKMVIYFHNLYAPPPTWVALETTVQNGIAVLQRRSHVCA
jgi:hypothetical protein